MPLPSNKNFCIRPWTHLHVWPDGTVHPCCMNQELLGDSNQQSLAEIWNAQPMRELRSDLLADKPGKGCNRCYNQEAMGLGSSRTYSNRLMQHHEDIVSQTAADGSLPVMRMAYMDVRISNVCNLRCRSCNHTFSSAWYDETIAKWTNYDKPRILNIRPEIIEELTALLGDVEEVYWAGGESLLIPEHWHMVDAWLKMDKTDVRMEYTTNFTNLCYKDRNILDVWARFEDVTVTASIDAQGARAEYLRKNCNWDQIIKNRRDMIQSCPHVKFMISPTVGLMNAWHVPDLHRSMVQQGLLGLDEIYINMLEQPYRQNVTVADADHKARIRDKVMAHIEWCRGEGADAKTLEKWHGLINWMQSNDHSSLLSEFWEHTRELDAARGEYVLAVWPELAQLQGAS